MFNNRLKKPVLRIKKGPEHQYQLVNENGEVISNAFVKSFEVVSNQIKAEIIIKGIDTSLLSGKFKNW